MYYVTKFNFTNLSSIYFTFVSLCKHQTKLMSLFFGRSANLEN